MQEVTIVAFGDTGSGKSTLGNTFLGFEAFIPHSGCDSQTDKTEACNKQVDGCDITFIDTPGFKDSKGVEDERHFQDMVTYLKFRPFLNALVFVVHFGNARCNGVLLESLKFFAATFKNIYIWANFCLVFTNVRHAFRTKHATLLQTEMEKIRDRFVEAMSAFCPPPKQGDTVSNFCIDSDPDAEMDPDSRADLAKFVHWAKTRTSPISLEHLEIPENDDQDRKCMVKKWQHIETLRWHVRKVPCGQKGDRSLHGMVPCERAGGSRQDRCLSDRTGL
jgi:hypothetical protein